MKKFLYVCLFLVSFAQWVYAENPIIMTVDVQKMPVSIKNESRKEYRTTLQKNRKIKRLNRYKAKVTQKIKDIKKRKKAKSIRIPFFIALLLLTLVGLAFLGTGFWQTLAIAILLSFAGGFLILFFGFLLLGGVGVC